ncbi:hypothetical protein Ahy_B06g083689 [Arachis hypogaea]|uniref:Uncharacterized protein n=1 Tax=Arachis hypogaea TaxID=3818 RepID=A0A444YQ64_ARAHY|nr:hypothetical protein Ahy_B06g083689 [Arachis hypogaea]
MKEGEDPLPYSYWYCKIPPSEMVREAPRVDARVVVRPTYSGSEIVTPGRSEVISLAPVLNVTGIWVHVTGVWVYGSGKMTTKNQDGKKYNQTKDMKCATRLLSEKFEKMSEPKKAIVRELGFGGLMHIPPMNVPHKLLKELDNSFKLGKNTLETSYGSFKVKPKTIRAAFGLNASGHLFPDKGNTLKKLTNDMMSIGVKNEQDRLMFKRIFILYIQMVFLLPSTITKVSPVHIAPIFEMEKITEGNWGAHRLKKKKSINGYLYALMIIYFYLAKNKDKKGEEKPGLPWVSNWNREQLVARIRAEIDGHMSIVKMAETKKKLKEMKKKKRKKKRKKQKKKPSSSSESDSSETDIDFSFESESE